MEKVVTTLGEMLAREAQRLAARRATEIAWVALLEPVGARCRRRSEGVDRFERHESVPQTRKPTAPVDSEGDAFAGLTTEGAPLPAATRDRLREIVGSAVDLARVHTGDDADNLARSQRADAVTIGEQVYFRTGAYSPDDPAGFALLAHEMTHVAESLRPAAAWRRANDAGIREEERLAHVRERALVRAAVSPVIARLPQPPRLSAPTGRSTPSIAVTSAQAHPMKAEMDRAPIDAPLPRSDANPTLDQMRRTLFRDLMNQIRVEYERGA
jgi:hypothetical protein